MTSIYPKLPGYTVYHDPTIDSFKRISSVQLEKIHSGEVKKKDQIYLPRQKEPEIVKLRDEKSQSSSQKTFINHFGEDIAEHFQPDWVKLDKQVLRFYGYFKESIVEAKREHARIRRLILYYYLVDDTISITEEKEVNSGIVQGPFLNRGKVKKEDGTYFKATDLEVGKDIYIYGKFMKLYDCDDYSREYYQGIGFLQLAKQNTPIDNFHESLIQKFIPKKDNLMKDFLEHKLGGGRVVSQKQFLENDRKVLKFNAKYDNLKYIIHYYLADDTVEIREVHHHNSGRDPFPLFLKRNKLPRKFSISQPGELGNSDYYKDTDIEPFMTLWAFNRPFKILGCDEFTEEYYMEKYGKKFPVGGFEEPPSKEKNSKNIYNILDIYIPPYNGFGDEEDSLGNCLRLIPKQPKKDYFKYIDNDKITLRFLARLNTQVPEDMERRFLISFFLADDTIQVYEMFNRNSGIWEGKFLERAKYKNVENDVKQFTISDFEINKSMRINSFSFHIIDADDFTKKWMAENLN